MAKDWSQYIEKSPESKKDWSAYVEQMPSEPESPSFFEKAKGLGLGFKHGVEKYTHGILKPVFEGGHLGETLKRNFPAYRQETLEDFERASERTPNQAMVGNIAGQIGVLAPLLAAMPGRAGVIPGAIQGAEVGGLAGLAAYPEQDESRLSNAIAGGVSGGLGAGLIGGVTALPAAYKGLTNKGSLEGLRSLLMGNNPSVKEASTIYNQIEKGLENAGKSTDIKAPNIDWKSLGEHIPKKGSKGLSGLKDIKKLVEKGTYGDLNQAQSRLSAWQRALESRASMGATNTKAIDAARDAEERIHGALYKRFMETNPSLAAQYQKANELYAKGMSQNEKFRNVLKIGASAAGVTGATLYGIDKLADFLKR